MKIKYVKGDLLEAPEKYILHGVNCQGVMGSGVAKLIRAKWPSAYAVYKNCEHLKGLRLGSITQTYDNGKVIFNGVTQEFYGRKANHCYVCYDAVREVMRSLNYLRDIADEIPLIAMPAIGAGLGGGDWNIISEIIEEESTSFQPVVYYLED